MQTTTRSSLIALICLAPALAPALAAARTASEPLVLDPASKLWIDGKSTVRKFSCSATTFSADVDATSGAPAAVLAGTKAVHAVVVRVPVARMECGNGTMNEHMRKALRAAEAPAIEFRLTGYDVAKGDAGVQGTLDGTLTLGGAQRPVAIAAHAAGTADGGLRVTGAYEVHMKEFGLKPPTLMMGTLKVDEAVTVNFDLILRRGADTADADDAPPASTPDEHVVSLKTPSTVPPITIQHLRPADRRGINVFEPPKNDTVPFTGFRLGFGAAFTQQFQGLGHSNTAAPKVTNGVDANQLITIGHGFNNAVANGYVNVQLARGVRVALTSYLSARHHNEMWVKDGYALIDASPIDLPALNTLMQYVTVKAGHFEINYGDGHFRRTDNGNAMFNPLVGNYILDAFTTEVGGELYLQSNGAFVMGAMTNGEVRGTILNPAKRAPAFYGKAGVDRQLTPDVRVRLTGSLFGQSRSNAQTLYNGDRGGSRYYDVLENTASTETAQAWSGAIQPFSGQSTGQHSAVVNPFLKYEGLEYFGTFERAKGRGATEAAYRTVSQVANEVTYRFLGDDLYVSGRYNTASGRLAGMTNDISVRRTQVGGGWFVTPLLLTKVEYVSQKYLDFPTSDIRSGGRFKGFMVEGTIAF